MSNSTPTKVKCQDCGFLAVRHGQTGELAETPDTMRRTGQSPKAGEYAHFIFVRLPLCFDRAAELPAEAGQTENEQAFLNVVTRERECLSFTRWHQGFTPKEHKVMLAQQEERAWRAEQERKAAEYRDKKDEQDRKYRDQKDREDAEWRLRQEAESQKQFRAQLNQSNRQLWIAGVAIAIIAAVLVCATQIYCTRLQISDARSAREAAPTSQPKDK